MTDQNHIYVALPILNESENIATLLECIRLQSFKNFTLVACINQYESWWRNVEKRNICLDNEKSIEILKNEQNLNIEIIDRNSVGKGWQQKKGGVGWARKTLMDYISAKANKNDIIISIDADTYYPVNYIEDVAKFL